MPKANAGLFLSKVGDVHGLRQLSQCAPPQSEAGLKWDRKSLDKAIRRNGGTFMPEIIL